MTFTVVVPRLGWTMEEGTFIEWLRKDGDRVQVGDMIFVLEGEKAAQEIESTDAGILRIPPDAPKPGATVKVGALLAYLVGPGEPNPWENAGAAEGSAVPVGAEQNSVSMKSERKAAPAVKIFPERKRPASSPRARRVAAELGVDWPRLNGSGRTGRIRERDVRAASSKTTATAGKVQPLSRLRRTIAERMAASARTTAPVTLTTKCDATELVCRRERFKSAAVDAPPPTYNDLLVALTAAALRQHPQLNACWTDAGIVVSEAVHVGIAVDVEAGLLVPVVRDAGTLSIRELAARSRELIEKARSGRLTEAQLQGGTFTITNLGMYSIDAFTPIINLPQCAVLGVGRIVAEPAVFQGQVVPRQMLTLSLTFDHRVVDGGPAARFLNAVHLSVETPPDWLCP